MNTALVIYAIFSTAVVAWALFQLSAEKMLARMEAEFRENDRKFYRRWEDAWFAEMLHQTTAKKVVHKKIEKPKRIRRGEVK